MARRDYYDDPSAPRPNSIVPAVTAVVIDDDGRILLIHRTDNDRWALPGGEVELGESVSRAVIREVHEETGIDVEITGLVGIYSDPKHIIAYDDGEVRQQFSLCFRARPIGERFAEARSRLRSAGSDQTNSTRSACIQRSGCVSVTGSTSRRRPPISAERSPLARRSRPLC